MRVGINGMGRIGRLVLRAALGAAERQADDPRQGNRLDVVHLNEIKGGAAACAHLLEFDSVQGRWRGPRIEASGTGHLQVGGRQLSFSAQAAPQDIPWGDLGVDVVMECTGRLLTPAVLAGHLSRGARRVIVAAPVHEETVLNVVMGVNHLLYDPARHTIVTAASCTTNCLAPVVKVVHEALGIRHGQITTIHNPTNTNMVTDAPHKDLRRARASSMSLIPTSTGSATAIGLIFPELQGRLNGVAVRVPLANASLTDCVFEVERATTVDEVNELLRAAAEGPLAGILGFEERPLVSIDYKDDPRSSIIDAQSTMVINGTQVKVLAWYDNEWGYANRYAELARMLASHLAG